MGHLSPQARREYKEQVESRRMALANKIAMVVIDHISAAIIRPGPKPEERECYIVAQELRDATSEITRRIAEVLDTELG